MHTWRIKAPPRHSSHWLAVTTGSLFILHNGFVARLNDMYQTLRPIRILALKLTAPPAFSHIAQGAMRTIAIVWQSTMGRARRARASCFTVCGPQLAPQVVDYFAQGWIG